MRDEQQRGPVSTYEQAIWALLADFGGLEWAEKLDQPLPLEARVIADIFWVSERKVRIDLYKAARSL